MKLVVYYFVFRNILGLLLAALLSCLACGQAYAIPDITENNYVYGPFAGEAVYVKDSLGMTGKYWVPGRMRVYNPEDGSEFSLVKFQLVETGDTHVPGLKHGKIETGGFVSFSLEPINPKQTGGSPQSNAEILWKGLEFQVPGKMTEPKLISEAGDIYGTWNINVMLEKESLDPLWSIHQRFSNSKIEMNETLVPIMKSTLVYRDHVQIDEQFRGNYSLEVKRLYELLSKTKIINLRNDESIVALMRLLLKGGILKQTPNSTLRTYPDTVVMALFSTARKHLLQYDLARKSEAHTAGVSLKKKNASGQSILEMHIREWSPVERIAVIPIEIELGSVEGKTIRRHGLARETKLNMEFIPWGDWSENSIDKVLAFYELSTKTGVIDVGSFTVNTNSSSSQAVTVASMDKENILVRIKLIGYWENNKYSPLKNPDWKETAASLRSHYHFIMPEDIGL